MYYTTIAGICLLTVYRIARFRNARERGQMNMIRIMEDRPGFLYNKHRTYFRITMQKQVEN